MTNFQAVLSGYTGREVKMTVELRIIINHFHDNDTVFVFDGKNFFCCLAALDY